MASRETLQKALNANYDLTFFRQNVLEPVFGSSLTIYSVPKHEPINPSEEKAVKNIKQYGEVKLTDYRQLYLYEVALAENVIVERNKVSIGAVVKRMIAGNNTVLVNFHYPHQTGKSWRLSFIAKEQVIDEEEIKKTETHPKRYTYVLGPLETCRTAAERFEKLSRETDFTADKLKKAFSVEKLSEKFFEDYKYVHYSGFIQHIIGERIVLRGKKDFFEKAQAPSNLFKVIFSKGKSEDDAKKDVRDFVKKLLGRIVFLYFVQKKGWLGASDEQWSDGDANFLQNLFIASGQNENFYYLWLRKLFFDTLNNPNRSANGFKLPDGKTVKISYLNGGLFEDDDPKGILVFPPRLFADLFEFFNQYNFTIYEDSPDDHTVAVDPEMLGHIFENLLEDNKDKGAFYTPKEIVHYMCQESLIEYLSTKLSITETASFQPLGKDQTEIFGNDIKKGQLGLTQEHKVKSTDIEKADVEQFIKDKQLNGKIQKHAKNINQYLDDVKICDPAIGSGAFPIGLLHEIFDAKQLLHQHCQDEGAFNAAEIKQNIIQNSIYGVDIEKGAVDIARLRFWLSLIVDEYLPRPLPNLDYKIVVGDSLLPKFEGEVVDIDWDTKFIGGKEAQAVLEKIQKGLKEIVKKQKQYFDAPEKNKPTLKAEIRSLKIDLLINQLTLNKIKYSSKNIINQSLFEKTKKDRVKELEIQLRLKGFDNTIRKLEQLKKQPDKPFQFFDWKLDFPEIMNPAIEGENAGFDIAIGNPPYIQLQKFSGLQIQEELQKQNFKTFSKTGDIYCLFYEKGISLLCPNGILVFITSRQWLQAAYGKALQQYLIEYSNPLKLLDFGGAKIFNAATVDTNVLITQKSTCKYALEAVLFDDTFDVKNDISTYFGNNRIILKLLHGRWNISTTDDSSIREKINGKGVALSKWKIRINYGLKTGLNEAFIIDNKTRDYLISVDKKSVDLIKPVLRGRDVHKYHATWANLWIILSKNGVDLKKNYRAIYDHLDSFGDRIKTRSDQGDNWWNLRACSYYDDFEQEKIIYPETTVRRSEFYFDKNGYFVDKTCFIITGQDLKYLNAALASKLIEFYLESELRALGKNSIQYSKQYIEKLPVPIISDQAQKPFITLVDQILAAKKKDPNADTSALEREIDKMVYALYGLTPEEIEIVEGRK